MDAPAADAPPAAQAYPGFLEATRFWLKLGFISFGGPAGQIAIMHRELVEKRRWISESRFLHALNYCHLLPGPEAQQLATYIGWLLHRTWGGVVAGSLFVLPSAVLLWLISLAYVHWGNTPAMEALFRGVQPAVLGVVAAAVIRLGKKSLRTPFLWGLAGLSFYCLFWKNLPFPLVVLGAGAIGLGLSRLRPDLLGRKPAGKAASEQAVLHDDLAVHTRPSWGRFARVLAVVLALWWVPLLAAGVWLGWDHILFQQGLFFSKAAMVTFGGAYAVLPYVAQRAVQHYHWLEPAQMLDGLAFAESTPGPLIMVLQFVGFMGAWKFHEPFTPLVAATLGSLITTWATFLPCFLWIFLGAPHVEGMRENRSLSGALSGISAAVVGVVLNLAVWFGLHMLAPEGEAVHWVEACIALICFLGLAWRQWGMIPVLAAGAALGGLRFLVWG